MSRATALRQPGSRDSAVCSTEDTAAREDALETPACTVSRRCKSAHRPTRTLRACRHWLLEATRTSSTLVVAAPFLPLVLVSSSAMATAGRVQRGWGWAAGAGEARRRGRDGASGDVHGNGAAVAPPQRRGYPAPGAAADSCRRRRRTRDAPREVESAGSARSARGGSRRNRRARRGVDAVLDSLPAASRRSHDKLVQRTVLRLALAASRAYGPDPLLLSRNVLAASACLG